MRSVTILSHRFIILFIISCILSAGSSRQAEAADGTTGKPVIKDPQRDTFFSLELELERLNDLIAQDNDNADYLYNRGWVYEQMHETDRAEKDYSAAIRINKEHADALYNRGLIYLKSMRYDLAIKDFSEVIRIKPESADAFCNRGNAYLAKGKHQSAVKDFTSAIRIAPQDPDLYYNRALIYLSMKKKASAMEDMNQSARLGNAKAKEYIKTSGKKL
jgi:tetratricopeptide (TPR) repeat protein